MKSKPSGQILALLACTLLIGGAAAQTNSPKDSAIEHSDKGKITPKSVSPKNGNHNDAAFPKNGGYDDKLPRIPRDPFGPSTNKPSSGKKHFD
jgi:hypothetical protein